MEDYDLRSCFLPNLAGLHLRIYQFQQLLHQHLPELAAHMDLLQVEGAYLSQWFLSFFATTCPLPMLFRVYDVIFAEGASETIMRVALSIMRRNEKKLLGFTEFEDAMQLLLSRALWDPYGLSATSADELVGDFVSFTSVVTRESLQALEASFREAKDQEAGGALSFFPSVQQAASRFLQRRLWTSNHTPSKSQPHLLVHSLTPGSTPSRPHSMLLRTPSKQSLSTLYSQGESSEGSTGTASTSLTEMSSISRESSTDQFSIKSIKSPTNSMGVRATTMSAMSAKDKDLHCQIEDLLMALTEMQRENATLAAQLNREREERNEDRLIVRSLVDHLKENLAAQTSKKDRRKTASIAEFSSALDLFPHNRRLNEKVVKLVESVDFRITSHKTHNRKSSGFETKAQLRQSVSSLKEQLRNESMTSQDLTRQLGEKEQENTNLKDELQKARTRIKDGYTERERLQKTLRELRQSQRIKIDPAAMSTTRSRSGSQGSSVDDAPLRSPSIPSISRSDTSETDTSSNTTTTTNGLREFKLGRTLSDRSKRQTTCGTPTPTYAKRTSSLAASSLINQSPTPPEISTPPPVADEALLQDLVASKTAEAVARQELEELKAKFETLRKMMLGISTPPAMSTPTGMSTPPPGSGGPLTHAVSEPQLQHLGKHGDSPASSSVVSIPTTLSSHASSHHKSPDSAKTPASGASSSSGWGGGFFGWGKRSASAAHASPPVESK
jgi:regulator of replication initiation timing